MRTLNIIKVKNGTPQIIEAFCIYGEDDRIDNEIIERAEYRFCRHVKGIEYPIDDMELEVYRRIVNAGYEPGVIITAEKTYEPLHSLHLVWANPS
jgi:hypothetical protein